MTEPISVLIVDDHPVVRRGLRVLLEVTDDGHGFDPDAPSGGLGLASMRERAAAAGGKLAIRSTRKGTTVRMTVPGKASG